MKAFQYVLEHPKNEMGSEESAIEIFATPVESLSKKVAWNISDELA